MCQQLQKSPTEVGRLSFQAEAEVVPSSSLVEVEVGADVEVGVGVEVKVEVGGEVKVEVGVEVGVWVKM